MYFNSGALYSLDVQQKSILKAYFFQNAKENLMNEPRDEILRYMKWKKSFPWQQNRALRFPLIFPL